MSTSRNINKICVIITVVTVLVTVLFMNGSALGVTAEDTVSFGYEDTLFDDSYVHTIDITMDNWDELIENATSEEYSVADVTIDGETVKNVGIRAKGNTSLSTVSQLDSERYSFKIEFDCYDTSGNYHGLDKLCLNDLIQDYSMMKDYITYKLMNEFGVDAPLVSFCYITVNGEDWGLYLAVEAVEDSFLERNYGTNFGDLYKPDSMSMGGGRGNGGDFDMKDMDFDQMGMKNPFERDGDSDGPDSSSGFQGGSGEFGMGSSDAKLQYIDDDIDSYSTIFNSAKTEVSKADKKRLIKALKNLSEGIEESDSEKIDSAVNVDEVMRYMVVHNFVVNGDSYTGNMIHNYYLYEEDGELYMIPWDYNLAFGTFQASDSTGTINDPIDTPQSITEGSNDRPMFTWITSTEEYQEQYHEYYQEFLDQFYTSGYLADLVQNTYEMIYEYVEKDPTKFCTVEEFETAVETMSQFVELRCQSIQGQLDGTIPSTDSGQEEDSSNLIDASSITLSNLGSMGGGGGPSGDDKSGGPFGGSSDDDKSGGPGGFPGGGNFPSGDSQPGDSDQSGESSGPPSGFPGGDSQDGDFPSGDFPGGNFGSGTTIDIKNYIYAGISVVALIAALIFAATFKRKKK
ncbi:CotH kinase family protein [Butyrivibrio proteoclasticus]|uniref:CotH kinase family protein n=1 Tax=Butyrivibrio proteoclasticus TaxID=43305 RepID=UPI00047A1E1A|nr:CotH kinase family protein [Butyrivibrio proteoclasticus]